MSLSPRSADLARWNVEAVCEALNRYVEAGGEVRFESDPLSRHLAITFRLEDADLYYRQLSECMADRPFPRTEARQPGQGAA